MSDKGYTLLLGGAVLGRTSMAQSQGQWGGCWVALALLNTSANSAYSLGIWVIIDCWDFQCWWRDMAEWSWIGSIFTDSRLDHLRSSHCAQEILGSWVVNQGWPRMTGFFGEELTYSEILSMWKSPVWIVSGMVCCVRPVLMGSLSTVVTGWGTYNVCIMVMWVSWV